MGDAITIAIIGRSSAFKMERQENQLRLGCTRGRKGGCTGD
jgi:hypothetical protein